MLRGFIFMCTADETFNDDNLGEAVLHAPGNGVQDTGSLGQL